MDKQKTLDGIREIGLLAVLRGPTEALTLAMVEALVRGGVAGIEITFTTPGAASIVRRLADTLGGSIVLGMGTLTEPRQASEAEQAGAAFLVAPHAEARLAEAMVATGLPVMLGGLTPSEVLRARRLGADIVKLFPASLGGPAYLRSLRGPFPEIPIMPTGGVSAENVAAWFAAGAAAVGAGSELCPVDLAAAGRFDEIAERARRFVAAVRSARTSSG